MRLYQIPFSHNCVKVRRALDLKGLQYDTVDINPLDRRTVKRASDQMLVPALVDDGHAVADSTAILLHLERAHPKRPLLPADPEQRAECLVLEDWADASFMELTRRLAYWRIFASPGVLDRLFLPRAPKPVQRVGAQASKGLLRVRFRMSERQNRLDEREARRLAALAVERLAGREHLVGDGVTIADVTLAAMAAPLQIARPEVREDPAVAALLDWARGVLGKDFTPVDPAAFSLD
jgi:glutathione S-transferase